jgi:hypothetical protein
MSLASKQHISNYVTGLQMRSLNLHNYAYMNMGRILETLSATMFMQYQDSQQPLIPDQRMQDSPSHLQVQR